jgi:hypothetical protein
MCEVPGLGIDIPSPLAVARGVAGHPRAVAGLAGGTAVVVFTLANVVLVGGAVAVFLGAMGVVIWRMRSPDFMPQAATVTTRQGQGARAITAGQRALPAPAKALPATVVTGRVVPAPARKVVR